jgi:hypothetical protein
MATASFSNAAARPAPADGGAQVAAEIENRWRLAAPPA